MSADRDFVFATSAGAIDAHLDPADDPRALLVLAHGAGADMRHRFFAELCPLVAARGIHCLRHQFPYTQGKRRRIDHRDVLVRTIVEVTEAARGRWPALPTFVGGKSMGGRMATLAAAHGGLDGVRGLVLLGFPLHPRGEVSTERARHLSALAIPSLFLHGTRDELGDVALLRTCLPANARLEVVEHADHGFDVLVRSGRKADDVRAQMVAAIDAFLSDVMRITDETDASPR
jgi:predicted alpha/beta-hydrolase family hydrolase